MRQAIFFPPLMCATLALISHCPSPAVAGDGELVALLLLQNAGSPGNTNTCITRTALTPSGTAAADTVTEAQAQTGFGTGARECLTNGVRGEGEFIGSLDAFSMAGTGPGATVILEWSGKKVTNGSGIDFVVFENAFKVLGNPTDTFLEPVIVEVTENDTTKTANQWCGFAPDYNTGGSESVFSRNAAHWIGFAGKTPVRYHQENNPLAAANIFVAANAGGDGFDLANLSDSNVFSIGCSTTVRNSIIANGFVYVRLVSATARNNPDTGSAFVSDASGLGGSPDIDGVIARYLTNR